MFFWLWRFGTCNRFKLQTFLAPSSGFGRYRQQLDLRAYGRCCKNMNEEIVWSYLVVYELVLYFRAGDCRYDVSLLILCLGPVNGSKILAVVFRRSRENSPGFTYGNYGGGISPPHPPCPAKKGKKELRTGLRRFFRNYRYSARRRTGDFKKSDFFLRTFFISTELIIK